MLKTRRMLALLAFVAGLGSAASVPAQESDTLRRIKGSNQIILGYRENSVPFSYVVDGNAPVGYAHDLSMQVVERIKTELNLPNLRVKFLPLTSFDRFDMIRNGAVDLECGSTSNTRERQENFAFSNNYFVSATRFATLKNAKRKTFKDLSGRPVAVTFGSTGEQLVQKLNADLRKVGGWRGRPIQLVRVRTPADGMQKLARKEVDAFVLDEVLLYGLIIKSPRPENFQVVGEPMDKKAYACMMRKDDPRFKALVDAVLARAMQGDAGEKHYEKWFQSPIPPTQRSLNIPLSPELKQLFERPDDQPLD